MGLISRALTSSPLADPENLTTVPLPMADDREEYGGVIGFLNNFGQDVEDTVKGLGMLAMSLGGDINRGLQEAVTLGQVETSGYVTPHIATALPGALWQDITERYGPMLHGDFSSLYEHPGFAAMDALAVANAAGKAGSLLSEGGKLTTLPLLQRISPTVRPWGPAAEGLSALENLSQQRVALGTRMLEGTAGSPEQIAALRAAEAAVASRGPVVKVANALTPKPFGVLENTIVPATGTASEQMAGAKLLTYTEARNPITRYLVQKPLAHYANYRKVDFWERKAGVLQAALDEGTAGDGALAELERLNSLIGQAKALGAGYIETPRGSRTRWTKTLDKMVGKQKAEFLRDREVANRDLRDALSPILDRPELMETFWHSIEGFDDTELVRLSDESLEARIRSKGFESIDDAATQAILDPSGAGTRLDVDERLALGRKVFMGEVNLPEGFTVLPDSALENSRVRQTFLNQLNRAASSIGMPEEQVALGTTVFDSMARALVKTAPDLYPNVDEVYRKLSVQFRRNLVEGIDAKYQRIRSSEQWGRWVGMAKQYENQPYRFWYERTAETWKRVGAAINARLDPQAAVEAARNREFMAELLGETTLLDGTTKVTDADLLAQLVAVTSPRNAPVQNLPDALDIMRAYHKSQMVGGDWVDHLPPLKGAKGSNKVEWRTALESIPEDHPLRGMLERDLQEWAARNNKNLNRFKYVPHKIVMSSVKKMVDDVLAGSRRFEEFTKAQQRHLRNMGFKEGDAVRTTMDRWGELFAEGTDEAFIPWGSRSRQKVFNFYSNMTGEWERATIDTWMARIFGYTDSFTPSEYQEMVDKIHRIRDTLNEELVRRDPNAAKWTGSQVQAALWVAYKDEYASILERASHYLNQAVRAAADGDTAQAQRFLDKVAKRGSDRWNYLFTNWQRSGKATLPKDYSHPDIANPKMLKKWADNFSRQVDRMREAYSFDEVLELERAGAGAKISDIAEMKNLGESVLAQRVISDVKGSFHTNKGMKGVITFYRTGDFTTLVHEGGHALRWLLPEDQVRVLEGIVRREMERRGMPIGGEAAAVLKQGGEKVPFEPFKQDGIWRYVDQDGVVGDLEATSLKGAKAEAEELRRMYGPEDADVPAGLDEDADYVAPEDELGPIWSEDEIAHALGKADQKLRGSKSYLKPDGTPTTSGKKQLGAYRDLGDGVHEINGSKEFPRQFVVERDGKVVGLLGEGKTTLSVMVDPEYRRQGLATLLYDKASEAGADIKGKTGLGRSSVEGRALSESWLARADDAGKPGPRQRYIASNEEVDELLRSRGVEPPYKGPELAQAQSEANAIGQAKLDAETGWVETQIPFTDYSRPPGAGIFFGDLLKRGDEFPVLSHDGEMFHAKVTGVSKSNPYEVTVELRNAAGDVVQKGQEGRGGLAHAHQRWLEREGSAALETPPEEVAPLTREGQKVVTGEKPIGKPKPESVRRRDPEEVQAAREAASAPEGPRGPEPPEPAAADEFWNRDAEEVFAEMVERYFLEGVAPHPDVAPIFESLREALRQMWRQVRGWMVEERALAPEQTEFLDQYFAEAKEALNPSYSKMLTAGVGPRRTRQIGAVTDALPSRVAAQVGGHTAETLRTTAQRMLRPTLKKLEGIFGQGSVTGRVKSLERIRSLEAAGVDPAALTDALGVRLTIGDWREVPDVLQRLQESGLQIVGHEDLRAIGGETDAMRGTILQVVDPESPDMVFELEVGTASFARKRDATAATAGRVNEIEATIDKVLAQAEEIMRAAMDAEEDQIAGYQKAADDLLAQADDLQVRAEKGRRYLEGSWESVADEIDANYTGHEIPGGPSRVTMARVRDWVDHHLVTPLVEKGIIDVDGVFDRVYLPLRLKTVAPDGTSARWDMASGDFVGGYSSLELDDIRRAEGTAMPVYFPHIDARKLRLMDFLLGTHSQGMRKMAGAGFLKKNRGALYEAGEFVTDPLQAYSRRAARALKWRDTYDLVQKIANEYGRRLGPGENPMPGEKLFAPDGVLRFFNTEIGITDGFLRRIMEAGSDGDGAAFDDAEALYQAIKEALDENQRQVIGVTKQGLEFFAIPETVAKRLELAVRPMSKNIRLFWDTPTAVWRNVVLAGSPRWIMNNLIGNAIFLKMQGGKVTDVLRQIKVGRFEVDPGFRRLLDEIVPDEVQGGLFHDTQAYNARLGVAADTATGQAYQAVSQSRPVRGIRRIGDKSRAINSAVEDAYRRASYLRGLQRQQVAANVRGAANSFWTSKEWLEKIATDGLTPERHAKALAEVNYFLNDYSYMTPFEKNVMRRFLAPFWAFYRHAFSLYARFPFEYANRAWVMQTMSRLTEEMQQELGPMPAWMDGAVPFGPTTWLSTRGANPFNVITDTFDSALNMTHPAIKVLIERSEGRNLFTGKPFSDPDVVTPYGSDQSFRVDPETGTVTPVDKVVPGFLEHVLQQFPQYNLAKDLWAGGATYDTSSLMEVMAGRGVIPDPETGESKYPYDRGQKAASFLGVPTFTYDLESWQQRLPEQQDAALRAYIARLAPGERERFIQYALQGVAP